MCFKFNKNQPKIEPVTDLTIISRSGYLSIMGDAGIAGISVLDSTMTITSKTELDRIAPYLVYPADLYIAEIFDCEDYGIMAQGDAARLFHVSGIRLGIGWIPLGKHGFVITIDTYNKIWCLEPNAAFEYAGQWLPINDEHGYKPEKVFA